MASVFQFRAQVDNAPGRPAPAERQHTAFETVKRWRDKRAIVANGAACRRWLERETPDLEEARKSIDRVIDAAMRASNVIRELRGLLRNTAPALTPLSINELIKRVLALAESELRKNHIVVQTELQADVPQLLADRVQLEQVLLNLILNSNQAMSAVDWPVWELVIRSQESKPAEVTITVRDSGAGLPPHSEQRIFDSFFSTKADGLGLGLSISRTIVEAHSGRLWATRNDDRGASFHFTLPAMR